MNGNERNEGVGNRGQHLAYVILDRSSIRRGGSTRVAACLCGWRGPERGTLELVTDDALEHEREQRSEDDGRAAVQRGDPGGYGASGPWKPSSLSDCDRCGKLHGCTCPPRTPGAYR